MSTIGKAGEQILHQTTNYSQHSQHTGRANTTIHKQLPSQSTDYNFPIKPASNLGSANPKHPNIYST
jgi:hypothetical protein